MSSRRTPVSVLNAARALCPRCGAHARSTGQPCKNVVAPGRTRCRLHGVATPRGRESPHYKHGRFSVVRPLSFDEWLAQRERKRKQGGY